MESGPYGGKFIWQNLLCRFFAHDIDPLAADPGEPLPDEAWGALAGLAARSWADVDDFSPLPDHSDPAVLTTLFHEHAHYWQLISSPVLQSVFLAHLQKLRLVVHANGGMRASVCGDWQADDDQDAVTEKLRLVLRLFGGEGFGSDIELRWKYELGVEPSSWIAAFWESSPLGRIPGFAVALAHGSTQSLVPINLLHLTESGALVSEYRFRNESILALQPRESPDALLYKSLWELWKRQHSSKVDVGSLCKGFLAIVDSALLAGSLEGVLDEASFPAERFGRLFVASMDFPPKGLQSDVDLVVYRDALWERAKFGSPGLVISNSKRTLLRHLVFSLKGYLGVGHSDWQRWIEQLSDASLFLFEEEIFSAVQSAFAGEQSLPVGAHVIGTFYNAIQLREDHPTVFIDPAESRQLLEERFPLPMVLMNGKYHGTRRQFSAGSPIPVWKGMLRQDILALAATTPMVFADPTCGFVKADTKCVYMARGFGCARHPERLLSRPSLGARASSGLLNWCHRTRAELVLGLAKEKEAEIWTRIAMADESGG